MHELSSGHVGAGTFKSNYVSRDFTKLSQCYKAATLFCLLIEE